MLLYYLMYICKFYLIYKKKTMTYALSLFYSYNNQVMYVFADYLAKRFSI